MEHQRTLHCPIAPKKTAGVGCWHGGIGVLACRPRAACQHAWQRRLQSLTKRIPALPRRLSRRQQETPSAWKCPGRLQGLTLANLAHFLEVHMQPQQLIHAGQQLRVSLQAISRAREATEHALHVITLIAMQSLHPCRCNSTSVSCHQTDRHAQRISLCHKRLGSRDAC